MSPLVNRNLLARFSFTLIVYFLLLFPKNSEASLSITSLKGLPNSYPLWRTIDLTVCFKNNSTGAEKLGFRIYFYVNKEFYKKIVTYNPLKGGETTCITAKGLDFTPFLKESQNSLLIRVKSNRSFYPATVEKYYSFRASLPDLRVTSFTLSKTQVKQGERLTATVCVSNRTAVAVPSGVKIRVSVLLSKTNKLSITDREIGYTELSGLKGLTGTNPCPQVNFYIPGDLKPGKYWIGAYVDRVKKIPENELYFADNNKSRTVEISVSAGQNLPNLTPLAIFNLPRKVWRGQVLKDVKLCVENSSNHSVVSNFTAELIAEVNRDPNSSLIGREKLGKVIFSGLKSRSIGCKVLPKVTLPSNLHINAYNSYTKLRLTVDPENFVPEFDEGDNTLLVYRSAVSDSIKPDLVIEKVTGFPAAIQGGKPFTIQICVKNIGTGPASLFRVGVYHSTNRYISTSDTLLATFIVKGLNVNSAVCESGVKITPPTNIKSTDYIGILVDDLKLVDELVEYNNEWVKSQSQGQKDLIFYSLKVGTIELNRDIDLQVCIKNNGAAVNTPFKVKVYYYRGDRRFFIPYDFYRAGVLKEFTVNSLGFSQKLCLSGKGRLPANFPTSTVWIAAMVDADKKISEFRETNNYFKILREIAFPDLFVSELLRNSTREKIGQTGMLNICIANGGYKGAGPFQYELALHNEKNKIDIKLHTGTVQNLPAGQRFCQKISVNLPSNLFSGYWNYKLTADPDNKVREIEERNNFDWTTSFYLEGRETLDLEISALELPKYVKPGQKVRLGICAKNNGPGAYSYFKVEFRFSKDKVWSPDDRYIAQEEFLFLPVGGEACRQLTVTIPQTLQPAGKPNWLLATIVLSAEVKDPNVKNNTRAFDFFRREVGVDLAVESMGGLPNSPEPGKSYTATLCVKNIGKVSTGKAVVSRFYLSSNSFISTSDIGVSEYIFIEKSIPPGKKECATARVTFPLNAASYRWLGAIADVPNLIEELNENNNTAAKKISFKKPPVKKLPDLSIDSVSGFPQTVAPGASVNLNVCVKNRGDLPAPAFEVKIAQKRNSLTAVEETLGVLYFDSGLLNGKIECRTFKYTYDKVLLKNSSYELRIKVDPKNLIAEKDEGNNFYSQKFSAKYGQLPDLVLTKFTVSSVKLRVNKPITIEYCVKNGGSGPVPFPFEARLYLGIKEVYRYKFIREYPLKKEVCRKEQVVIPPAVKPGASDLSMAVDLFENLILETEEVKNNMLTKKVTVDNYQYGDIELTAFLLPDLPQIPRKAFKAQICLSYSGKIPILIPVNLKIYFSERDKISWLYSYEEVGSTEIPAILPGDKFCLFVDGMTPLALRKYRYIIAEVNGDKRVTESDYKNNLLVKSLDILTKKPNLTVDSIHIIPSALADLNSSFEVKFCIRNAGLKGVSSPFKVAVFSSWKFKQGYFRYERVRRLLAEIDIAGSDLQKLGPNSPPFCKSVKNLKYNLPPNEKPLVTVKVDSAEQIQESNERDNLLDYPLSAAEKFQPNLIISSLEIKTSFSFGGWKIQEYRKNFYFKVCLKNIGSPTPSNRDISLAGYLMADEGFFFKKIVELKAPSLKRNEEKCFAKTISFLAKTDFKKMRGNLVKFQFRADEDNKIGESREDDNRSQFIYFIVAEDSDKDGVFSYLDCDDSDKNVYPAFNSKPPAPEICDAKDNDCDGKVDEDTQNLGKTCSAGQGACKVTGLFKCDSSGKSVICNTSPLVAEKCDGKDNDCDGKIDNGADKFCPAGFFCSNGSCKKRPCRFHYQCPFGLYCSNGYCAVLPKCKKNSDCPRGFQCSSGNCSAGRCSDNAQCGKNQVCDLHGLCSDACSSDAQCPSGSFCRDGRCFVKCQSDTQCAGGFRCLNGVCAPKCQTACKKGEFCLRGQCVKFDCTGYGCPKGLTCRNFTCYDPEKSGVSEKPVEKAFEPSSEPAESPADGGEFAPSDRAESIADTGEVGAAEAVEAVGESAEFVSSDRGEAEGETVSVEGVADGGDSTPGEGVEGRRREPGTTDRAGATDRAGTTDRVVEERGRDKGAKGPERAGDKVSSGEVGGGVDGRGEAEGCGCWGGGGEVPLWLLLSLLIPVMRRRRERMVNGE